MLSMFRPFELIVDVVFKHATFPTGTVTSRGLTCTSCNIYIRCLFWKFMFTNLVLHICQSDRLCSCQLYMFCALYFTSGTNYKRDRLICKCSTRERVRLAGH